jgi:hypothetical protein
MISFPKNPSAASFPKVLCSPCPGGRRRCWKNYKAVLTHLKSSCRTTSWQSTERPPTDFSVSFVTPRKHQNFFRAVSAGTRDYYAARDFVDLERAQIIRLLSYSRRLALTMAGGTLIFSLLFLAAMVRLF